MYLLISSHFILFLLWRYFYIFTLKISFSWYGLINLFISCFSTYIFGFRHFVSILNIFLFFQIFFCKFCYQDLIMPFELHFFQSLFLWAYDPNAIRPVAFLCNHRSILFEKRFTQKFYQTDSNHSDYHFKTNILSMSLNINQGTLSSFLKFLKYWFIGF